jgi:hypothetical protein
MKIIVILLFLLLFSCKSPENKNLEVSFYIRDDKNNNIQLFYSNNFLENYLEENSIKKQIINSETFQKVTFQLNTPKLPTRIRIDFGEDPNNKSLEIKNLHFFFKGGSKTVYIKKLDGFFLFNENIIYNPSTNILKLKSINGKYDPYIVSKNLTFIYKQLKNE